MTFSYIVSAFFTSYLGAERGLAPNTIASYSDAMKLLIDFACRRFGVEPEKLCVEQLDRELIVEFLDHLEGTRGNAVATRNQRLAAIKTFFHFLAGKVPELLHLNATDMVHGAYALDGKNVVIVDTLEADTLDVEELRASIEAISVAVAQQHGMLAKYPA